MRDMIVSELSQAMHELARGFAHFLPRLIVMLVLAFVGWVIAYIAKILLLSILRLIKFDRLSDNAGASQLLTKAALPSSSELLSRFVFWVAWLGFILLGVSVRGLLAASFFSRAALLAGVNANLPSPRLLSISIRSVIIIFVLSVVFEELGLAEQTMLVTFGLAFGAVMLGLAIAFGMGGGDLARRFLETRFLRRKKEENEDELSPL